MCVALCGIVEGEEGRWGGEEGGGGGGGEKGGRGGRGGGGGEVLILDVVVSAASLLTRNQVLSGKVEIIVKATVARLNISSCC